MDEVIRSSFLPARILPRVRCHDLIFRGYGVRHESEESCRKMANESPSPQRSFLSKIGQISRRESASLFDHSAKTSIRKSESGVAPKLEHSVLDFPASSNIQNREFFHHSPNFDSETREQSCSQSGAGRSRSSAIVQPPKP